MQGHDQVGESVIYQLVDSPLATHTTPTHTYTFNFSYQIPSSYDYVSSAVGDYSCEPL